MNPRQRIGKVFDGAVERFNNNPWGQTSIRIVPRATGMLPVYDEDGLWTSHAHSFTESHAFDSAYRRAVKAAGADYGIRWRVHVILWAASHCQRLEGAFVECGTGRGFMASAICENLKWDDRPFYLYDTFLPYACDEHGGQALGGQILSNYAQSAEKVGENFAEWPGVELVVGQIPESLRDHGSIAFLHVDLNHASAEEAAIRHFWPRLDPSALVIFDDYGFEGSEEQRLSADRLGKELGFQVLSLPTGQGLVLRGG